MRKTLYIPRLLRTKKILEEKIFFGGNFPPQEIARINTVCMTMGGGAMNYNTCYRGRVGFGFTITKIGEILSKLSC